MILNTSHIKTNGNEYWNLTPARLIEQAIMREEGKLCKHGCLVVNTGKFTGRAAKHKYTVYDKSLEDQVWWNEGNKKISASETDAIFKEIQEYFSNKDLFILDAYAGAEKESQLSLRVIAENAWHSAFAQNMFRIPTGVEQADFYPEFTIYHAPNFTIEHKKHNLYAPTFVILDLLKKRILISGTSYAGEIKKSIFSVMNYILPLKGILSMHCSANTSYGENESLAIFFGLSGTGKTTLSSDSDRLLIGDDEHGWSNNGVFNIEGGCYAKMINLSSKEEPEIFAMTQKFGTILENTVMNETTRQLNLYDNSISENTRASYSLENLPHLHSTQIGKHPSNIIMLTADAFGVLPPVSRLSKKQALYHFLSGYTAKLAGTEDGITQPIATFSTCFGAPFMLLKPSYYANVLTKKLEQYNVDIYLVNTGWTRGAYGEGHRMPISETRAIIRSILDNSLKEAEWKTDSYWGLQIPTNCTGVSQAGLHPIDSWPNKKDYIKQADLLRQMFHKNFEQYKDIIPKEIQKAGF